MENNEQDVVVASIGLDSNVAGDLREGKEEEIANEVANEEAAKEEEANEEVDDDEEAQSSGDTE